MATQKHKTWVCTICSQSFTRNSSAKRHDSNLHEGNADYVRYIDYEIGRIQGKYYQNDPALFKKKSHNYNNLNTNKQSLNVSSERTKLSLDDHYFNLNSFSHLNNESSQPASFFDKHEEIMEMVDQINNIAKDVWSPSLLKEFTLFLLLPYLFNRPNPKITVEKYFNWFKEITAQKRLSNLFKS
jgi:hypothetical protein